MTVNETQKTGWGVIILHPSFKKGHKYLKDYGDYNRGELLKLTSRIKSAQCFKYVQQAEIAAKMLGLKFKEGITKVIKV